jgi:hypothetical protein
VYTRPYAQFQTGKKVTEEGKRPQGDRLEDIVVTPTKYEPGPRKVGWGCLLLFILGAAFIAYNALPGFVYSRRAVNEKKAVETLRAIREGQVKHIAQSDRYGSLVELLTAGMIDEETYQAAFRLAAKTGYYFNLELKDGKWACTAIPVKPGVSANKSFYIDETGIIRISRCEKEEDEPAGPESTVMGK